MLGGPRGARRGEIQLTPRPAGGAAPLSALCCASGCGGPAGQSALCGELGWLWWRWVLGREAVWVDGSCAALPRVPLAAVRWPV